MNSLFKLWGVISLISILCTTSLTAQDITTGLVAHYKFEETTCTDGSPVSDAAGNHTGTIAGSDISCDLDGKIGNAFLFGGNSYINLSATTSDITGYTEFTLAAWVKPSTLSSHKTIMSKITTDRDFDMKFYNTTFQIHHYNGAYRACNGTTPGNTTEWVHYLCTWKNNQWRVYRNGILESTCDFTSYPIKWLSAKMYIGGLGNSERFVGSIDEVRIYNRALTDNDADALYKYSGSGGAVTSVNSYTGSVQLNLSLTGDNLSISGGNTITLPYGLSDITGVSVGTGLLGGGSSGNIDINASYGSALWNANKLQGKAIAATAPSSGQVLKWNGSSWAPATDETGTGGSSFWTQSGTNIFSNNTGNVGIGTNPDQKLTVKGKIHAEEVIVDLNVPAPDYVFEEKYRLRTAVELEEYLKQNNHLPDIPSAKEMEGEGVNLSLINLMLLKKIEELTLYIIDQEKRIKNMENSKVSQK